MKMILAGMFTVLVSLTVAGSAYAAEQMPDEILVAMASTKSVCGGNTGKACPGDVPIAVPAVPPKAPAPPVSAPAPASPAAVAPTPAPPVPLAVVTPAPAPPASPAVVTPVPAPPASSAAVTPIPALPALTLSVGPAGYTFCANEDQTCSFSGTKSVAYGAKGQFSNRTVTAGTPCTNAVFGDVVSGVIKACYIKDIATATPTPTIPVPASIQTSPPSPTPTPIPTPTPTPAVSTYSLSVPAASVTVGANVTVTWSAPSGSQSRDWVGLFKSGDSNEKFIGGKWTYTNGVAAGSYTTSVPTTVGSYEFRYLLNNGYSDVARSSAVAVTASPLTQALPTPTPTPATTPTLIPATTPPASCTTNCGTTQTLTINATNASKGVTITMEPTDVDGLSTCNAYPCVRHYNNNTIVTVHAPDMSQSGYYDRWSGGCNAINNNEPFLCTVTMGADKAVSASFGGDGCRIRKDIAIGQTVTICWNGPINVYSSGDNSGRFVGSQPVSSSGTVVGGPFNYDNDSDYVNVNFNTGVDGWLTTGNIINGRPANPKFSIGNRVQVNASTLNVRQSSSVTSASLGTHIAGDQGTVIAGRINNLSDNFIWWNIKYDSGAGSGAAGGWSAEDFLSVAGGICITNCTASPTPAPAPAPTPTSTATATPTVTPTTTPTAPIAPVGSYSLSVPTTSVSGGGTVTATWSAPTGSSAKDWVALYKVGDSNTSFIAGKWMYISGATSGSFTTTVPTTSGTYEFRLLKNDGYTDAARSGAITVVGTTSASIPAPTLLPTGVATFYLATNGSDSNNGLSLSTPWRTLQHALASIGTNGAGKTLIIRGGEYDTVNGLRSADNRDTLIPTGSSWSSPFTFQAYSGEAVTFVRGLNPGATLTIAQMQSKSCGGLDCVGAPTYEECAYYGYLPYPDNCWSGGGYGPALYLKFDRSGQLTGALIDATQDGDHLTRYVIFDGIIFDARGINGNVLANSVRNDKNIIQQHFRFLNGEWRNSAGSCMAQPGVGGEWEYDPDGNLHQNEFEFLHFKIHHCGIPFNTYVIPGTGINAREYSFAKFLHGWYMHVGGNTCDDCELYKNAGTGVGPDGPNNIIRNSYIHDNACIGVQVGGGLHHQVYNSVFYNNGCVEMQLLSIGNSVPAGMGHKIYNNTLIAGPKSDRDGLLIYNGFHGSVVENNIIDGYAVGIENQACGYSNGVCVYTDANVIRNNFIRTVPAGKEIYNTGNPFTAPILSGNILNQDPRFVNPAAGDFRLQGSSPAINAGANNGLATDKTGKTRNGTIDIGAFEFGN